MRFENCNDFEFSTEPGSEVSFHDYMEQFETLQKEQNIKVNIISEEIADALKLALRQSCEYYFLTSQLFEEVKSMGYNGWCGMIPPFPYTLEFFKGINLIKVYSVNKACAPKIDISGRSMQRITGRLKCDYQSSMEIFKAGRSDINSVNTYNFITIVLFVLI
jgi:hypothetical protein